MPAPAGVTALEHRVDKVETTVRCPKLTGGCVASTGLVSRTRNLSRVSPMRPAHDYSAVFWEPEEEEVEPPHKVPGAGWRSGHKACEKREKLGPAAGKQRLSNGKGPAPNHVARHQSGSPGIGQAEGITNKALEQFVARSPIGLYVLSQVGAQQAPAGNCTWTGAP